MFVLDDINKMSELTFKETFQSLVENSPWVASQAWRRAPFKEFSHLQQAIVEVIMSAGPTSWEKILDRHTVFTRLEHHESNISKEVIREAHRIGLDQLNQEEFQKMVEYTHKYRDKFGFSFVICLANLPDREFLFEAMEKRLNHNRGQEMLLGIREIIDIAKIRLAKMVKHEFQARTERISIN